MKVILIFSLLCLFSSCSQRILVSDVMVEVVGDHLALLELEKKSSGEFFQLRMFHQGLMSEVPQTHKFQSPYDSLEHWFNKIYREADTVAMCRIQQDALCQQLDTLLNKRKKIAVKNDRYQKAKDIVMLSAQLRQFSSVKSAPPENELYQSTVEAFDIKRISYFEYAEKLNEKVMQWQDSLEQVGRLIAAEKVDLKRKFPQQKGDEFFGHYRHVSELESKLKAFDGSIMQLQNSLSRFEGANQEEYFYIGPHLEIRREVQATESILADLVVAMQDCRLLSVGYWNSY